MHTSYRSVNVLSDKAVPPVKMARWAGLCILISIITGGFSQDDFLIHPVDQTVEVGHQVIIQCQINAAKYSNYAMAWYRETDKRYQLFLYYKESNSGKVNNPDEHEIQNNTAGQHNLVIKSAKLTDGGRYSCEIIFPEAYTEESSLVVVEIPIITSDLKFLENTHAELTCEGRFGSPPEGSKFHLEHRPFLQGYINRKILDDVESTVTFGQSGVTGGKAVYRANTTATANMDQTSFLCEFRTEMPAFYVNSEKTIEVHHEVSVMEIEPMKSVYYPGDMINCSANGNPAPTYSWFVERSPGSRPVSKSVLHISENMIGENIWECRAKNQPAGSLLEKMIAKKITFTVEPRSTEKPPDTKDAGGDVVVIVVVCVIAVLIIVGAAVGFYCFRSKKRKNKDYNPQAAQHEFNLESDMGDVDDDDERGMKKKPKPMVNPESKMMLPNPVPEKENLFNDPEKRPLKTMPPPDTDLQENNGKASLPQLGRESAAPPTPPPPFEEAAFKSLLENKQPQSASRRGVPPGAKPVLPLDDKSILPIPTEPPTVSRKPTPKARSGSKENLADKPRTKTRSKENVADDSKGAVQGEGTSV